MSRILAVDDVAEIRLQIELVLRAEGHEVVAVDNGATAWALLEAESFDLVVTDVLMPEMDGVELIKLMRQHCPETKVLAISGGGLGLPAQWSLKMTEMFGADASLYKPFDNEKLIAAVRALLGDAPET